jgi:hypothetical protein
MELIPQFYFNPNIFISEGQNSFTHISVRFNQFIPDFGLPTWADTPDDFVYHLRRAFDSEFTSGKLLDWIKEDFPSLNIHSILKFQKNPSKPTTTIYTFD